MGWSVGNLQWCEPCGASWGRQLKAAPNANQVISHTHSPSDWGSLHTLSHSPLCCLLLALWSSAIPPVHSVSMIPFGAWLFHSLYYLFGTSFIYRNDIHAHRETETEPWCGTLLWDIYAKIFCLCWINILIQELSGWTSLVESLMIPSAFCPAEKLF